MNIKNFAASPIRIAKAYDSTRINTLFDIGVNTYIIPDGNLFSEFKIAETRAIRLRCLLNRSDLMGSKDKCSHINCDECVCYNSIPRLLKYFEIYNNDIISQARKNLQIIANDLDSISVTGLVKGKHRPHEAKWWLEYDEFSNPLPESYIMTKSGMPLLNMIDNLLSIKRYNQSFMHINLREI